MSVKTESVHPTTFPFDSYLSTRQNMPCATAGEDALQYVAMAKRILLQERVQQFTGADVVALAAIIAARDTGLRP